MRRFSKKVVIASLVVLALLGWFVWFLFNGQIPMPHSFERDNPWWRPPIVILAHPEEPTREGPWRWVGSRFLCDEYNPRLGSVQTDRDVLK